MKKRINLSIIVPILNEAKNIEVLTKLIFKTMKKNYNPFELIYVDDDSNDNSQIILEKITKKYEEVKFINRKGPKSLSMSVIEGFKFSTGDFLMVMDGDLQHDPKYITELLNVCNGKADICVASRYVKEGIGFNEGSKRQLISLSITFLTKKLLKIYIQDPLSGYFVIKRKVFEMVLPNLSGIGFKILLEIIFHAKNINIVEIPLNFNARYQGKSKANFLVFYYFICQILSLFLRIKSIEFISFCIVGSFGVLVFICSINVLYYFIQSFTFAYVLSFILITTQNYALNQTLTFNDIRQKPSYSIKKHSLYFLANVINLIANTSVANFVFYHSNLLTISSVLGIIVGIFWNFFTARLILKN